MGQIFLEHRKAEVTPADGPVAPLPGSGYRFGVLAILFAALAYSTAGVFTKGVAAGAWEVIFWRGLFAAGVTTLWLARGRGLRTAFVRMGAGGWAVAVIGAAGTAAFIPAFKLTSIAHVSLIYATSPLIAALMAWLALRERVTARTMAGCGGALLGVAIIVSSSLSAGGLVGDLLALMMTVAMAAIMVIYRARPQTPVAGPAIMQSLLLLPVALCLGSPLAVGGRDIVLLALFGVLFALASVALAAGAKRVPAGQAALLGALETPLAPLLAFLLLAELPGPVSALGGLVVFVAVLGSIENEDRSRAQ